MWLAALHLPSTLCHRLKPFDELLIVVVHSLQLFTHFAEFCLAGLLALVIRVYLLTKVIKLVFHREVFRVCGNNLPLRERLWDWRINLRLNVLAVVFQLCDSLTQLVIFCQQSFIILLQRLDQPLLHGRGVFQLQQLSFKLGDAGLQLNVLAKEVAHERNGHSVHILEEAVTAQQLCQRAGGALVRFRHRELEWKLLFTF